MSTDDEKNSGIVLSPKLQDIITDKQAFFEKYEQFIDFYELERMIERRGKLTMPELALHIVRVRGQKILDIYKTEAAVAVALASFEIVRKEMARLYAEYEKASSETPELAGRYEEMMLKLLDRLDELPIEDLNKFRDRFG
jgi:hypothetical protein